MIQVVLTMDTLDLVPFEGTQLQRVEDFDASKFHIKELRIKDLHKNLCKKPYFHVRLDSHKRTTTAAEPAEANGGQHRSSLVTWDADYETCEEDGVVSVPQDPILRSPSETTRREEIPADDDQASHRHSKRKTRLPGKFRDDDKIPSDFPERYVKYYKRGEPKSKVKPSLLKEKIHRVQTQFFEVPIEAHEVDVLQCDATAAATGGEHNSSGFSKVADSYPCTPSERKTPIRPLKQIYRSPSSGQKRYPPTTTLSKVSGDYTESMEGSTDTEPCDGPSKTPKTSSMNWKHNSPDATKTKEVLSNGKWKTVASKSKEKARGTISWSKLKEKKVRPLEGEWKRPYTAPDVSREEILPLRWRLNSPDASASMEEFLPTEKKRSSESKFKEKKSRTIESMEEISPTERKRTPEHKFKEKKSRTIESVEGILPTEKKRSSDSKFKEEKSRIIESMEGILLTEKKRTPEDKFKEKKSRPMESVEGIFPTEKKRTPEGNFKEKKNRSTESVEGILPTEKKRILESKCKEKKSRAMENKPQRNGSRTYEDELNHSYYTPQASTKEPIPPKWRHKSSDAYSEKRAFESKSKGMNGISVETKWKEKEGRTPESELKWRHSAPHASVEEVLPMKWKHPKEKWPLESKWKEKTSSLSASSTEKLFPLKRKHSYFDDASMEHEIPPPAKKNAHEGKLKEKKRKTPENKSKEKKAKIPESELKQSSNTPDAKDGKPARRARIPIRKLKGGYTSEDDTSDVELVLADGPGTSYPRFATEMKHSNVITCFWMGIPASFCADHMPDHDQFVVLQDATGVKWEANYLARKKGLSGGWRRFALDHHLDMGDTVIFELVRPKKFLVHISKVSGVGNATETVHHPIRDTPKKVEKPEHQASTSTKRVSSLQSSLFASRKRMNEDAQGKLSTGKKPCLVGSDAQQRNGEEWVSPVPNLNRLFHSKGPKRGQHSAGKEADGYEDAWLNSDGEDSEGEGEELETQRGRASINHLCTTENNRRDSCSKKNPPELRLVDYEKSPVLSSFEPQKAGPLSPKPGPPKKKIRRVSYFYSTDEDQGNSS